MRKLAVIILISYFIMRGLSASAVESFIIEDIQYQNFRGGARVDIVMNDCVEYVSYELEDPYRIIIDPLEDVYCDYEDKVYFDEGLIKSIEFIKTKEKLDFLAIEVDDDVSYEVIEDGPSILLDVSQLPGELEIEEEPEEIPEKPELPPIIIEEKEVTKKEVVEEEIVEEEEIIIEEEEEPFEEKVFEEEKPNPPAPLDLTKELAVEDCVRIAIENHLPLKIAGEQVELAGLKVNESFREMLPFASLLWSESHGKITDQLYRGRKYGFEFKQPLFHGGELILSWQQARTNLKVAQENYNKVKEELVHDVSKAYYELVKALNNLDIQKELYEDIKSDLELARKEYELGLSTQLENLSAQTSYDQAYYSIANGENDVSLKMLALNKAMNIDISTELVIGYRLELKEFDINIDECVKLAMQNRAELKSKELMAKSTRLGERIANSQTWPQLDVYGKYLKAAEELEPRALGWNLRNESFLGVMASVPFGSHTFDFTHKRGKLAPTVTTYENDYRYNTDLYKITPFDKLERYTDRKSASIAHQQALSDLEDVRRKIHSEVKGAFYSLVEARIKLDGSLNNLKLYEKELLVAQVKKNMNEATVSEVMDAKIKLFNEKANYANALGDIYLAVASLNKAVGIGGYFK